MVTCWTFVGLVLALGALGNSLKMFEIEMASKAQSPEANSPSERIALPLRPFEEILCPATILLCTWV